jgi:hypothetical protein
MEHGCQGNLLLNRINMCMELLDDDDNVDFDNMDMDLDDISLGLNISLVQLASLFLVATRLPGIKQCQVLKFQWSGLVVRSADSSANWI